MDPIALTRRLVDLESITGNEGAVGEFLLQELKALGFAVEKMPVPFSPEHAPRGERFNVYARAGDWPEIVFSTHMDTVPPFFPSREDQRRIYGRGACDAKGIISAQIAAALQLRSEGRNVGLLYVVGEERDSLGAAIANAQAPTPRPRYLINGEPTDNCLASASKGSLRVQLSAQGRMAHSAYPELGESAVNKLLDALQRLRAMPLPVNPAVGPATMNIGSIEGGRAPNVIPDFAGAQLQYRLVGPSESLRREIQAAVTGLAEVEFVLEIPFVTLKTVPGMPTMVAAFTTDIPGLDNWGEPLLLGPGSIHVAHTDGEYVDKAELLRGIELYCRLGRELTSAA